MTKDTTIIIYDPKYKANHQLNGSKPIATYNPKTNQVTCIQDAIQEQTETIREILEQSRAETKTKSKDKQRQPLNMSSRTFFYIGLILALLLIVYMTFKRFV